MKTIWSSLLYLITTMVWGVIYIQLVYSIGLEYEADFFGLVVVIVTFTIPYLITNDAIYNFFFKKQKN